MISILINCLNNNFTIVTTLTQSSVNMSKLLKKMGLMITKEKKILWTILNSYKILNIILKKMILVLILV